MDSTTVLVPTTILILVFYLGLRCNRTIVHTTPSAIRSMLNPLSSTPHHILSSRSRANARLIKAFALTNTFVSANPTVHTAFVRDTTLLIKAASKQGWYRFQQVAAASVDAALSDHTRGPKLDIAFDSFIQDVTLRVILIALFRVDAAADELDAQDICTAASLINRMWSLSKTTVEIPDALLYQLNTHVRRLLPDTQTYPNPLDFIIPTWETLWRVVATAVAHASAHNDASASFAELRCTPTFAQFRLSNDSAPSAEWCITETMRLHPPSKHITRSSHPGLLSALPTSSSILEIIILWLVKLLSRHERADIGTVLRSRNIWGPGSDAFDPLRFTSERLTKEQEMIKLLPFGYGPHSCIAARWAPMAAAMISAEILHTFRSDSGFQLVRGPVVGDRSGWEGWVVKKE